MTFPEGKLRTGLPVAEAKAFAKEVLEHPEWVGALIEVASHPEGGTVPRKAAWVLRHAAWMDSSCVSGLVAGILDAVDQCEDTSVHRELLKALLEVPDDVLRRVGPELYDLGLGLCADSTQPVAMVYVGAQLLTASGCDLGEEVQDVWRERGASAQTAPLARFLSRQLTAIAAR